MATHYNESGLEVDSAAKAPEVSPYQGGYSQQHHQQDAPPYQPPAASQSRLPFGLGVLAFSILVAGLTAIIIGGAVGGGLGGALADCRSKECAAGSSGDLVTTTVSAACDATGAATATSSIASTSTTEAFYRPSAASEVGNLTFPCTETIRDGSYNSGNTAYGFKYTCRTNLPWNSASKEGGRVVDVAAIVAYTFEDCMEACAQMTRYDGNQKTGVVCRSVVFTRELAKYVAQEGANCWLKNGSKPTTDVWGRDVPTVVYAEMGSKN